MIYTEKTKKAMKLCFTAHRDQVDKGGLPYVLHPFHLAEQMSDEDTTVVALLHDVVEDTAYTLEHIRAMGFGETVVEALTLMTHDKAVPYMDYVAQIKGNPIARAVKLADLRHNSDLSRIDKVDEKALRRIEKYKAAIRLLEGEDGSEESNHLNRLQEIVEGIKESADELRAQESSSEMEYGQLLAYAESLSIIRDACAGYDLASFGLDFDVDERYLR